MKVRNRQLHHSGADAPVCPACGEAAEMQHIHYPIYGHHCVRYEHMVFWTDRAELVFLSLAALVELAENGHEDP